MVKRLLISLKKEKAEPGFYRVDMETLSMPEKTKQHLYIRSLYPVNKKPEQVKVTSIMDLPVDQKKLLPRLNANLRRKISKAEKSNFSVKRGKQELLNDFYSVYTRNMYRLGSPAYGKSFFNDLFRTYDFGEALFFVLYKKKKPVASAMLMSYNGFWENTWFSTMKEAQKEYVSDFLHWQMIKYAIKQNASVYSFGRSDENGSVFWYKNHWPVENVPLYEYSLNRRVNLKNHKWLSRLWHKIPFSVTCLLGPKLIKHIY